MSACGGRWRTITTSPDDDSSDTGGSVGVAGASTSHAGAGHAGANDGQAGAATAGGSSTVCNAGCPVINCVDGSVPVTPTGECCPVCQSVCKQVCTPCAAGTQAEMHIGACCPDCVPTVNCAAGQMSYEDVRSNASYKFSFGCSSDSDCAVVAPVNLCESGCGSLPVVKSEVDSFTDYLKSEADQDCVACKPGPVPPCVAPSAAHCYGGQCAFSPP